VKFHDGLRDQRDEWRGQPLTKAALALLAEHAEITKNGVISSAASGEEREVRFAAGKYEGLMMAIAILSEE
jgi:hypothetical protein